LKRIEKQRTIHQIGAKSGALQKFFENFLLPPFDLVNTLNYDFTERHKKPAQLIMNKRNPFTPTRNKYELGDLIREVLSEELDKALTYRNQPEDEVLTTKEAANFLRISLTSLNKCVAENTIQSFKIGRGRRFLKSSLVQLGKTTIN
jgi:excisionase family DNA binding protein